MSSVTTTIMEKLQGLPSEKQQVVLDMVELLEEDTWKEIYQGRFAELQREIQVGLDASARGEVIQGDVMFAQLREKLQQRKAAAGQ
jgi:antitoxin ParD1/3/4